MYKLSRIFHILRKFVQVTSEPIKLDDAVDQVRLALFSETTRPAVIFVDAVNQVLGVPDYYTLHRRSQREWKKNCTTVLAVQRGQLYT